MNAPPSLSLYDGSILNSFGSAVVPAKVHDGSVKLINFVIVENSLTPILGVNASVKLGFLKVNSKNVYKVQKSVDWDALLKSYDNVFKNELGTIKGVKVSLRLKDDAVPVFSRARPVPYALREKVEVQINRLLSQDSIEKVDRSEWASPCVNVRKPDGSIRMCSDFSQTINPVLVNDQYPFPTTDELFHRMSNTAFFGKYDMRTAFEQLVIDERSRDMLTINTHLGLFRHKRLPYGCSASPAIMQRTIEYILRDVVPKAKKLMPEAELRLCMYLDDICVASNTEEGLFVLTKVLLAELDKHGARLNRAKCVPFAKKIKFLGHVLSENGLEADLEKIECIQSAFPRNKSELRSILGVLQYYGKFCPKMSDIIAPLNNLLKEDIPFEMTPACVTALDNVKKTLTEAPILSLFDPSRKTVVQADSSPVALGAVLSPR